MESKKVLVLEKCCACIKCQIFGTNPSEEHHNAVLISTKCQYRARECKYQKHKTALLENMLQKYVCCFMWVCTSAVVLKIRDSRFPKPICCSAQFLHFNVSPRSFQSFAPPWSCLPSQCSCFLFALLHFAAHGSRAPDPDKSPVRPLVRAEHPRWLPPRLLGHGHQHVGSGSIKQHFNSVVSR